MEIKLSDIYFVMSNRGAEQSVMSELLALRPSPGAKACYWFGKMMRLFAQETGDVEKLRTKLIEEIGVEDEDGNMHIPMSETEKMEEFVEKFNAVLDESVNLPLRRIKISELGECPVTIELMNSMSFMIDSEESVTDSDDEEDATESPPRPKDKS